jgi:tetratricopeptide (TPR) repeat protein
MTYMRRSFLVCVAVAWAGVFSLVGCDSFTDGYDEDPNQATEAEPNLALTGAEVGMITVLEGNAARISGVFANQFTGSDRQYRTFDRYGATASDFDGTWSTAYSNVTDQTLVASGLASQQNNRILRGIARIVQGHTFGTLAALFGDIPYEQALNPDATQNPEFAAQSQVYAGVQDTLSAAIADLESGAGEASGDIFFGGASDPWIEVAHTLRARYYLHTGNYEQALAEAEMGISTPDNNLVAPHGNSASSDRNIYHEFIQERSGYLTAAGAYAPRLLGAEGDASRRDDMTNDSTRSNYYYTDADGDDALDLNYCASQGERIPGETVDDSSCPTRGFVAESADFPLVTYSENQLIRAEAQLQAGGDSEAALEALNNVRSVLNDRFDPVDSDDEQPYEMYESGDFDTDADLLEEVLEEKYLVLIGNIEAFNDLRRTDNYIGVPPKTGSQIPQRFLYAQTEINANSNAPESPPGIFVETPVNEGAYESP